MNADAWLSRMGNWSAGPLHLPSQHDDTRTELLFTGSVYKRGCAGQRGGGRALINAVYQRAKNAGSSRVYWLTHETNQTARELYNKVAENSGFVMYRKLF
jgi:GNAT superfamily N-acetyltransferase